MKQNLINKSLKDATREAGVILKSAFESNTVKSINKGQGYYDVVSKADFESEEIILKILNDKLPSINILSEEKGFIDRRSEHTIVVDPLDGSSNFLLGIPHFSIAVVHLYKGVPTAAVVYNPVLNKMYFAEKGKGVFLNDKKLKPTNGKETTYISINFGHKDVWANKKEIYDKLYAFGAKRVLNNWSPNLDFCLLAEGKIHAVISNNSLIFDSIPGFVIAKEAGYGDAPKIKKIVATMDGTEKFVIGNKAQSLAKLLNYKNETK